MITFGTTVKSWCHPYLHEDHASGSFNAGKNGGSFYPPTARRLSFTAENLSAFSRHALSEKFTAATLPIHSLFE